MMVTLGGLPNAVQLRVKLELANFSVNTLFVGRDVFASAKETSEKRERE